MRPIVVSVGPSLVSSANDIALSQTPGAAGALTLNGSLVTGGVGIMDVARRVIVNSTGNDASVIFTVVGTDRNGNVQNSTVTGLNVSNGFTALDFLTVTAVNSSAATVGAITVGTNGVGSTAWQVDDFLARYWALSVWLTGPAGTTYTLETTIDDPNAQANSGVTDQEQYSMHPGCFVPAKAWPDPIISGVSGDNHANYPGNPIFAHRLTITGGTGKVSMQSIQATVGSGH